MDAGRKALLNARTAPCALLVLGAGNELLGDEGLGVHVARRLASSPTMPPGVAVLDAGTGLFDLLPELPVYERVVIVDAIRMDGGPGTVYRVELDGELDAGVEEGVPLSLHQYDLLSTLAAAKLLGLLPRHLTLIGAEPQSIQPGLELSPAMESAAERIVSLILSEAWLACPG
ncbi:MAG: hydrogenase maturation protease [Acidobacteria bacterium]|nr:hydrogenase maturation protease [Acidobacteriota bacterium]